MSVFSASSTSFDVSRAPASSPLAACARASASSAAADCGWRLTLNFSRASSRRGTIAFLQPRGARAQTLIGHERRVEHVVLRDSLIDVAREDVGGNGLARTRRLLLADLYRIAGEDVRLAGLTIDELVRRDDVEELVRLRRADRGELAANGLDRQQIILVERKPSAKHLGIRVDDLARRRQISGHAYSFATARAISNSSGPAFSEFARIATPSGFVRFAMYTPMKPVCRRDA